MTDHGETIRRLQRLNDEVARAASPDAIMALGEAAFKQEFDFNLFTIQTVDLRANVLERAYSSNLEFNPLGVRKQIQNWDFADLVVHQGKQFVGHDKEDIRATFFDHEILFRIGCHSILSTPVLSRGKVVAIVNILHPEENHFTDETMALARLYAQALLPAFASES